MLRYLNVGPIISFTRNGLPLQNKFNLERAIKVGITGRRELLYEIIPVSSEFVTAYIWCSENARKTARTQVIN